MDLPDVSSSFPLGLSEVPNRNTGSAQPHTGISASRVSMSQQRSPSPTSSDAVLAAGQPLKAVSKPTAKATAVKRPRNKPKRRFLWQEDQHLRFVAAIFDLGLKNASPKTLLPLMKQADPDSGLTTEHLKSHLQKYRINYDRSRREFQELCDQELKRTLKRRRRHEHQRSSVSDAYVFPTHSARFRGSDDSDLELAADDSPRTTTANQEMSSFAIAASRYPTSYPPAPQAPPVVPVSSAMPEFTDAQWLTFSMLMSSDVAGNGGVADLSIQIPQQTASSPPQVHDELQTQMHEAMQAQMTFHRQMLTRKVQLSNDLQPSGTLPAYAAGYGGDCSFNQAWAHQTYQRQLLAAHRLEQQQTAQYGTLAQPQQAAVSVAAPPSVPGTSLPSLVASAPEAIDSVGDEVDKWDPFNVGLEDDDLFNFLKT